MSKFFASILLISVAFSAPVLASEQTPQGDRPAPYRGSGRIEFRLSEYTPPLTDDDGQPEGQTQGPGTRYR